MTCHNPIPGVWICGGTNGDEVESLVRFWFQEKGVINDSLAKKTRAALFSSGFGRECMKYNKMRTLKKLIYSVAEEFGAKEQ